mmetsp:Transcript_42910/g.108577  ORF Transcript_42910/g.108577 Transcript_42910/m.108577 type:complete len:363 (+) Transcript_42910:57-1145(+)
MLPPPPPLELELQTASPVRAAAAPPFCGGGQGPGAVSVRRCLLGAPQPRLLEDLQEDVLVVVRHALDIVIVVARDLVHQLPLQAASGEVERGALAPKAAAAADAVQVGFVCGRGRAAFHRDVVVDDEGDLADVKAARQHVGRYQNLGDAVAELAHHAVALLVLHLSLDARHREAVARELAGEVLGALPGLDKDDGLAQVLAVGQHHVLQQLCLVLHGGAVHTVLLYDVQGEVLLGHKHLHGVRQHLGGEALDALIEGGGEEQHLAVGALPLDLLHHAQRVVGKAVRLEHVVRLVKHEDGHELEAQHALGDPVLQRAVRPDDDLVLDLGLASAAGARGGGGGGGGGDAGVLAHLLQHHQVLHH